MNKKNILLVALSLVIGFLLGGIMLMPIDKKPEVIDTVNGIDEMLNSRVINRVMVSSMGKIEFLTEEEIVVEQRGDRFTARITPDSRIFIFDARLREIDEMGVIDQIEPPTEGNLNDLQVGGDVTIFAEMERGGVFVVTDITIDR